MSNLRNRIGLPALILNHPANQGQRGRALVRSALFQARARLTHQPLEVRIGQARMLAHIGVHTSTRVVYGSPPDWNEMCAWKRLLSPGDRFIDVGASVGIYSLWAADLGASVVAIEADAASVELLKMNLALNPNFAVTVVQAAASDRPGKVGFTVGMGAVGSIGQGVEVDATTLDVVLADGRARGVKIDVEGFEHIVLQGAASALADQRVDIWQLEWNRRSVNALGTDRQPVADMLETAGYVLARPDRDGILHPAPDTDFGADMFAVLPHVLG